MTTYNVQYAQHLEHIDPARSTVKELLDALQKIQARITSDITILESQISLRSSQAREDRAEEHIESKSASSATVNRGMFGSSLSAPLLASASDDLVLTVSP